MPLATSLCKRNLGRCTGVRDRCIDIRRTMARPSGMFALPEISLGSLTGRMVTEGGRAGQAAVRPAVG